MIITRHMVGALLSILATAAPVYADCAWVLWLGTGSTYTPFGAYGPSTGERDCKDAAAQLMGEMRKDAKQLGEFLRSSSRYICLPDTVDPRGPKAK